MCTSIKVKPWSCVSGGHDSVEITISSRSAEDSAPCISSEPTNRPSNPTPLVRASRALGSIAPSDLLSSPDARESVTAAGERASNNDADEERPSKLPITRLSRLPTARAAAVVAQRIISLKPKLRDDDRWRSADASDTLDGIDVSTPTGLTDSRLHSYAVFEVLPASTAYRKRY